MARKEYPFVLKHDLDRHIRKLQALRTVEENRTITLKELYKEIADYIGVSENAVGLVRTQNYNPSLVVAMALAKYLDVPIDELFEIVPREEKED